MYPFGHGLSYSEFEYSDLNVDEVSDNEINVSFKLRNKSNVKGKEVAQLYIRDLYASVTRPVKELKGFEIVELDSFEEKEVVIKLSKSDFGFYNNVGEFIIEPGEFIIFVGGSSATTLEKKIDLQWKENH